MKFGSLFSGIGGLDLGLERAGMQCVWQSEIDPYASRVLKKHWPDIPNLGDINEIDWQTVSRVDLICGGYPCQPFSLRGARRGENDPRHLWPKFADAIRILRPRYALLENVASHLSLGFGHVLADLATLGYDTKWDCIPAAAVGAPHLRDRLFVIATRNDMEHTNKTNSRTQLATNTTTGQRHCENRPAREPMVSRLSRRSSIPSWRPESTNWPIEPDMGRMANGVPDRLDRLAGLGNAVVPQVAQHMGQIIMDMAT